MRSALTVLLLAQCGLLGIACAAEGDELETTDPSSVYWAPDARALRRVDPQDGGPSVAQDVQAPPSDEPRPTVTDARVEPTDALPPVPNDVRVCLAERCGNGADDDCDGMADCRDPDCAADAACRPRCVEQVFTCDIPNCNDHNGSNESDCRARGNRGGCTAEQLTAWCTRRVSGGHLWDEIHRRWVAERCGGGAVVVRDNTYECRAAEVCKTWRCTTPLVLIFDPDRAVSYHPQSACTPFDLSTLQDGSATSTDWPTAATPWLARDIDGDGAISSGRELFGSATALGQNQGAAINGFDALGALDSNGDGVIDGRDPSFAELVVWADDDADRVSDPGEMRSLTSLGVFALEVSHGVQARCDLRGNCELERARFWFGDRAAPRVGAIVDVHLTVH